MQLSVSAIRNDDACQPPREFQGFSNVKDQLSVLESGAEKDTPLGPRQHRERLQEEYGNNSTKNSNDGLLTHMFSPPSGLDKRGHETASQSPGLVGLPDISFPVTCHFQENDR